MAYIYSFCFYFSLRLGSIIVGIMSFIQGLLMMITFIIGVNDPDGVSKQIKLWVEENDLSYMESFFELLSHDPNKYMVILLTFSSFYTISCIMLIYGAYAFITLFIYPFVAIEFVRLAGLFALHIVGMMLFKQNVINLGLLIGLSVLGGFVLLGLSYMWLCTLSLAQVIKELIKEIEITDITNFPRKPANMPDIYTVRNQYFNY